MQVRVLSGDSPESLQRQINFEISAFEQDGHAVRDIKFSTAPYGDRFSACVIADDLRSAT